MKKLPLHTKIILGLVLGLVYGLVSIEMGWSADFTVNYIKPIGTIFVKSLKIKTAAGLEPQLLGMHYFWKKYAIRTKWNKVLINLDVRKCIKC